MAGLKLNFAYQIAYQLLIVIMPLITSPYLSRVIGSQGLGEYSYSYSIAYYFSLFILLGVNNHGIREIAKIRNDKTKTSEKFWSIYIIQLIMGSFIIIIYWATQIFGKKDNTLAILQLLYICSAVLDINWLFFGLEKFKVTVTRNFIIKLLTVASIFLFIKQADDVVIYTFITALGFLLSQILLWPFALKEIPFINVSWGKIAENIKPLLILFIPVIAVSIFKYMDKIMLGYMCSKNELGFYDSTEKIMSIPTGVITALGTVMLPRITSMMVTKDHYGQIMRYLKLSLSGSMMLASPLAFGLAAVGPTFAPWFWGEDFFRCGILIRTISISIIFLSWANVIRTQYLIPNGKEGVFVRATIYGAIVNFAINYTLIGRFAAMGTVIGTVVAEFTVAFYQTVKCRKELPLTEYLTDSIPYIISGAFMYIIIQAVASLQINRFLLLMLEVISGTLSYVILMLIYFICIRHYKISDIKRLIK